MISANPSHNVFHPVRLEYTEDAEMKISTFKPFVVVHQIRYGTRHLIKVGHGDDPFPTLDKSLMKKKPETSLWNFLFGSPPPFPLYLETKEGVVHEIKGKSQEIYAEQIRIIQVIDGERYLLSNFQKEEIDFRPAMLSWITCRIERHMKIPTFSKIELAILVCSLYLDYGTYHNIPELSHEYLQMRRENFEQLIPIFSSLDKKKLENFSIHPLYLLFACTELGKSLRYHKMTRRKGRILSNRFTELLSLHSMQIIKSLELIDHHFRAWIRFPYDASDLNIIPHRFGVTQPYSKIEKEISRFDYYKDRLVNIIRNRNNRNENLELSLNLSSSCFSKAYTVLTRENECLKTSEFEVKNEYITCLLKSKTVHEFYELFPIYWTKDSIIVHKLNNEEDLMKASDGIIEMVSTIMSSITMEKDNCVSIDEDLVDMRYLYRIEEQLERNTEILQKMISHGTENRNIKISREKNLDFIKKEIETCLENQIRAILIMGMSILRLSLNPGMFGFDVFEAILMISEWIDASFELQHNIHKHFEIAALEKNLDEILLEMIIEKKIDYKYVFRMARFLSGGLKNRCNIENCGWIISTLNKMIVE